MKKSVKALSRMDSKTAIEGEKGKSLKREPSSQLERAHSGMPPLTNGKSNNRLGSKQRSAAHLDQATPSRKSSISPTGPQAHSAKAANGTQNNRTGKQVCSKMCPWLLKSGKFTDAKVNDFELGRVIGRGLMGTVRVAKTKNGKFVVLKSIKKESISRHKDQRHIRNERDILYALDCRFCVRLFGHFQDKLNVNFILEYAPGGELFHRLGKKKAFDASTAKFYASEIFVALEHLQSLGFVYRDLKPENITLDEEGHCKLVDFGFATPCSDGGKLHTMCGTPAYLSPEQLDGKLTNGYTHVVDWWSYGVLIYELLTGKTPFCRSNDDSHYEIFLRILKSKISFPMRFDAVSKELISCLCHPQMEKRLVDPAVIRRHKYYEIEWSLVAEGRLVPPFVPRLKDEGDDHYFEQYREAAASPAANEGRGEYIDF